MLYEAAVNGHTMKLKVLLKDGANPNEHNDIGETPLHGAIRCRRGQMAVIRTLLRAGANPTIVRSLNPQAKSALQVAETLPPKHFHPEALAALKAAASKQRGLDVNTGHKEAIRFRLKQRVSTPNLGVGTVEFIGTVENFHEGVWIGICLEQPLGKNDGSLPDGRRLFGPCPKRGVFVRPYAAIPETDT